MRATVTARFDVAVAGAGPAGSTAALLFARQGFRTILIDQAHFPRDKACAEYMSPGVGEVLQRIGLGDSVLGCGPLAVPGMDIISPRGRVIRIQYGRGTQAAHALSLPRRTLDAVLVEEAARQGVEVLEGTRVRSTLLANGAVTGLDIGVGASRLRIDARLVVIADGAQSALTRNLGAARPARWPVRLGLVAHYSGRAPLQDAFGQMHVGDDGYCGIAPLPPAGPASGPRLNVAMVMPLDAVRRARVSPHTFFLQWISAHPLLRDLLDGCVCEAKVRGVGPIGARCARVSFPGALVVGDAAGFFDPFTGEGIYRALRGAELAAEIGGEALQRGDVSGPALAAYTRRRTRAFSRKSAVTALVQLFVRYPALLEYAVPRLRQRPEVLHTLSLVLGDLTEPERFLRPTMLWQALRP